MNTSFNMTVELTPEQVKEAIKEYVSRNIGNGMCATKVDLNVELSYEDRPMGSRYPKFRNATVKVRPMDPYEDR